MSDEPERRGRGRPPSPRSQHFTVRIRPELLEQLRRLNRVADARVIGRNVIIEKALERFMDELERSEEL